MLLIESIIIWYVRVMQKVVSCELPNSMDAINFDDDEVRSFIAQ